jgi:hypothetical protein
MEYSPIRSKLMGFDETPSKNVVACDINGWMDTGSKKQQSLRPKSFGCIGARKIVPQKRP